MKKIAIIGASHFQNPLILKAKEKGLETHVFAWASGDIGEQTADYFYPISITEKEEILARCVELGIDGVASIASDLANITVAYVADAMGLTSNSVDCVRVSTDKHLMRGVFEKNGDPSPKSRLVCEGFCLDELDVPYPVIVKPTDRSGSRGITRLEDAEGLEGAISRAMGESFSKTALVEQYVDGREFSVEFLSWRGDHAFLALTEKFTTGAPRFIERGHLQPARVTQEEADAIKSVVRCALDSLGVEYGASHSEVKIDQDGNVWIVEIGSRMGGDCIGSHLVELSTGYDFLSAVVDVAMGVEPSKCEEKLDRCSAVRFVFDKEDLLSLEKMQSENPDAICFESEIHELGAQVVDSSSRFGYFVFSGESLTDIELYLPSIEVGA